MNLSCFPNPIKHKSSVWTKLREIAKMVSTMGHDKRQSYNVKETH